jgi:rhodanese-related sulfurtransferase
MADVPELTPTEFHNRWGAERLGEGAVILLDVRELDELELAAVPGALHIPMRELPSRLTELDRAKPVVALCHSGVRSRWVTEYLAARGFEQVFNLTGGIDAWSREIDPSVPRY